LSLKLPTFERQTPRVSAPNSLRFFDKPHTPTPVPRTPQKKGYGGIGYGEKKKVFFLLYFVIVYYLCSMNKTDPNKIRHLVYTDEFKEFYSSLDERTKDKFASYLVVLRTVYVLSAKMVKNLLLPTVCTNYVYRLEAMNIV
jgi:hypothetical protein